LGVTLPVAATPAANDVSFVVSGTRLVLSGQLPSRDGMPACLGRHACSAVGSPSLPLGVAVEGDAIVEIA
jgi:hypothetical protein